MEEEETYTAYELVPAAQPTVEDRDEAEAADSVAAAHPADSDASAEGDKVAVTKTRVVTRLLPPPPPSRQVQIGEEARELLLDGELLPDERVVELMVLAVKDLQAAFADAEAAGDTSKAQQVRLCTSQAVPYGFVVAELHPSGGSKPFRASSWMDFRARRLKQSSLRGPSVRSTCRQRPPTSPPHRPLPRPLRTHSPRWTVSSLRAWTRW